MGQIVSGVRISASFQIIPRLMGWLGSQVRVSVSAQSFALRMFVCPVMVLPHAACLSVPERSFFSVPSVLSRFRDPRMALSCAVACFLRTPHYQLHFTTISHVRCQYWEYWKHHITTKQLDCNYKTTSHTSLALVTNFSSWSCSDFNRPSRCSSWPRRHVNTTDRNGWLPSNDVLQRSHCTSTTPTHQQTAKRLSLGLKN